MNIRPACIACSATGLLTACLAMATPDAPPTDTATPHLQRSPAVMGAPSAVAGSNQALVRLAREDAALVLVDHAAQQALTHATRRVAAMHAFIEASGQAQAFAQFSRGFEPSGMQITFREALDTALDHLAPRAAAPASSDLRVAEAAVQVHTAAAHLSFDHLNAARRTVEMLATFLQRAGQLGAYQAWAAAHPASVASAAAANDVRIAADPGVQAAASDRRALQLGWDAAQHAYAQQAAQHPGAPPAMEPGTAVAHGPYASSWWNSYADPYYDISGTPAEPASEAAGWQTPGYSRASFPAYPELGPTVVPAFGMFPTGAAGGQSFGPGAGSR